MLYAITEFFLKKNTAYRNISYFVEEPPHCASLSFLWNRFASLLLGVILYLASSAHGSALDDARQTVQSN